MTTIPSTTSNTVERQAPTALLAIVQHIHEHGLGAPLAIFPPSLGAAHFQLSVVSQSLDAWLVSGLDVTRHEVTTRPGSQWSHVDIDGLLQPYGIRVQLVSRVRADALAVAR